MNTRPDQKRFDAFIKPLIELDPIWEQHKKQSGFVLEMNPYRKPGRLLKRSYNKVNYTMTYTIELFLEPIWFEVEFSDTLPYTFAVCALCDKSTLRWKIAVELEKHVPLIIISNNISNYFGQAFSFINKCTPEYVTSHGQEFEFESTGWKLK